LICVATCLFAGAAAAQQNFPNKPIRLIVPFPPGGPADIFARQLATGIGAILKQQVVVENVGGAGGSIGVGQAARAAPDGYTWALATAGTVTIVPFVQSQMPYDPLKDLALVTLVAKVPQVLVISPSVPANDLKSLIAHLKAKPGHFASSGAGSITHLAGELFKFETKADMTHVPYKGAVPALTDLMGDRVQVAVLDVAVVLPFIKEGKVKAIAVTSGARVQSLPDVPSMAELGFPKINSDNWFSLVGNANIPSEIQQRMNAAAVSTLKQPTVVEDFAKLSAETTPSTQAEFREFLQAEQAKWAAVIKAIGYKE
ncbi:MAG TPA: tripartite tricarboxylate transporter substrate-binding protein, partial [Luteolibacter sp.]